MALLQTQDFEGQTSGTTITTGNSGTAPSTAYTTVNTGAAATVQYDSAHAMHGTNAGKFATAGTSTVVNALQTFTAVATVYGRFYIYSTDWTSSQNFGARLRAGGVQAARICFDSTGHVNIHNSGNTSIVTGSVGLSNATWYRVEFSCTPGTSTTGAMTVNVYAGDSLTLLDSCTTSSGNLGTASIDEYGVGLFTAVASVSAFWIDDTNVNDSALPGPAVTSTPISSTDTGGGSDGGESISAPTSGADTGAGADGGEAIAVSISDADTGTGVDGGETISVPVSSADTGSGADAGELISAAVTATDTGAGADAGESIAAAIAAADTGAGVDSGSIVIPTGVPFLTQQFGPSSYLLVEAAWGADLAADPATWVWTDITADIYYATKLIITPGRPDNTGTCPAATCSFTVDNTSGDYTPESPASTNYPYVRLNTPIRASADIGGGETLFFQGGGAEYIPTWDTSAKLALVKVTAAGTLRRLGQGKTPLRSPLYRAISTVPVAPYGWWTMEDGSTATALTSALAGGTPLVISGSVAIGAAAGPGTAASADFSGGGSVSVALPVQTGTIAWRVAITIQVNATAPQSYVPLQLQTTTGTVWELEFDTSSTNVTLYAGTQQPGFVSGSYGTFAGGPWAVGSWHSIVLDAVQTGADMGYILTVDGVAASNHHAWAGQTLGWPTAITVNPGTPVFSTKTTSAILAAHLAVWASNPTDDLASPAAGWAGELPDERLTRVCDEEGIDLTITGTTDQPMGPQPIAPLLTILRDCEATDGGVLFDGFGPGLGYICLSSRYNLTAAVTVDAALDQLAVPFAPVYNDQRIRNDVTASQSSGTSSARYIDEDGPLGVTEIGNYDTSVTVNAETDDPLLNIAAWNVGLGTVRGLRYPTLPMDFAAVPALAQDWLDAPDISFRLDVLNVVDKATQHPPDDIELIVEGYQMVIDTFNWTAQLACSPYAPWQVAEVDDTDTFVDADDAAIAVTVPAGTTGTYNVTVGTLWSTSGADYPIDLDIGGERITCSGVTGGLPTQAFTFSARGVNGVTTAHQIGDAVTVWQPARVAL